MVALQVDKSPAQCPLPLEPLRSSAWLHSNASLSVGPAGQGGLFYATGAQPAMVEPRQSKFLEHELRFFQRIVPLIAQELDAMPGSTPPTVLLLSWRARNLELWGTQSAP